MEREGPTLESVVDRNWKTMLCSMSYVFALVYGHDAFFFEVEVQSMLIWESLRYMEHPIKTISDSSSLRKRYFSKDHTVIAG